MQEFRSSVGGEAVPGGVPVADENPSDLSQPVGIAYMADVDVVDRAVAAARESQLLWAATNIQQRHDVLMRASTLLHARRDEVAKLISLEEGKILKESLAEVERAVRLLSYFAAEAMRNVGDRVDSIKAGAEVEIIREPVGVVGVISPWNFPLAIPTWKIAPALAFGNAVVLKPSEVTPGTAALLVEILDAAGIAKGAVNLVLGGAEFGTAIVEHPGIDAVTFTGSTETGRRVAGRAAGRLAKVQLEMGGKNPLVVLDDANVETAVNCAMMGLYHGTGQKCTSSSRFIVQAGIHDAFVDALVDRLKQAVVGHALDAGSEIGPVATSAQMEKNLRYLRIGKEEGAELAIGGERLSQATEGHYLSPALLVSTSPHMRINREEIFGPVGTVQKVASYEEALAVANDTEYGLSAGICTGSLKHATHFKRHVRSGVVTINLPTSGGDYHVAFGGVKASGYGGKEQGQYARDFFTNMKSSYLQAS